MSGSDLRLFHLHGLLRSVRKYDLETMIIIEGWGRTRKLIFLGSTEGEDKKSLVFAREHWDVAGLREILQFLQVMMKRWEGSPQNRNMEKYSYPALWHL